jgi:phosphoribosyl 1,2-cyclic phosphodiesterase
MFQTSVLVSGSKGNAIIVRTEEVAILLDAGVSARTIFSALEKLRIDKQEIKAVLISHEHSDHVRGAGAVCRILKVPVYINLDTYSHCEHRLGKLPELVRFFDTGNSFRINNLCCHPFSSSHDAADSCNFTFTKTEDCERKLGVATDLGFPTALSINKLKHCTTLILESNHDERMLMEGPYDWALKQRIKSIRGHLSNLQAVGVISQVMHHKLDNLILAHLSEINNAPELARVTMSAYLKSIRSDLNLLIADQYDHTPLLNV